LLKKRNSRSNQSSDVLKDHPQEQLSDVIGVR
jgi:hypothetical protein